MTKVLLKVGFEVAEKEDDKIRQSINGKFSQNVIDYLTVPRIGEWIDLLELSHHYNLSPHELKWLSVNEHKYRIENVNKCDGYIEAELDTDSVWPSEA